MSHTYEFDVKELLRTGSNRIEIKLDSVLPVMRDKEAHRNLPTWAYPGAAYVRKEPCNFGWDWSPTLITCGIWRKIEFVAFDTARLEDLAILQDHSQPGKVTLASPRQPRPAPPSGATAEMTASLGPQNVASATAVVRDGHVKAEIPIATLKALVAGRHGRATAV